MNKMTYLALRFFGLAYLTGTAVCSLVREHVSVSKPPRKPMTEEYAEECPLGYDYGGNAGWNNLSDPLLYVLNLPLIGLLRVLVAHACESFVTKYILILVLLRIRFVLCFR